MPSNILAADTSFPALNGPQSTDEKFQLISDYLYMLLEQLRYSMANLGRENFNDAAFDAIAGIITEPVYIQLKDVEGNVSSLTITAAQLISRMTDAEGNISTLQQTANSLISRIQDAEGNLSSIEQYAKSIKLSVSNGDTSSLIQLTAEGTTISSQTIRMKGLVTFTGLAEGTTVINGGCIQTGLIDAAYLNLRGAITFSDLSNSVQDDINDAYTMAKDAQREVTDVSDTVSGWTYRGTTYMDGAMLMTGTVMASHLIGGDITLLTDREATAGFMSITGSSSSSFAVDITSYGALRLTAETGNVYIEGGSGSYLQLSSAAVVGDSDLVPNRNARNSCGTAGQMWSEIYAASSEIVTSDRNEKHNIDYDLSKYESLFDGLKPCSYQYNNGRSGRTHTGMIAQDVEALLAETGIGALGFAGFVKSETEAGDTVYALRYEEFVALCVDQLQKLKARVAELEERR